MGLHMNLDHHEPPNGDFVVLIERLVGMPPSDPEVAARELSEQLRERAKARDKINREELSDETLPNSVEGPPDISDALESMADSAGRRLVRLASYLLFFGGAAMWLLIDVTDIPLPFFKPFHGALAMIAGAYLMNRS